MTVSTVATVLAASTVQAVGATVAVLTMIGFAVYVIANVRAGRSEVGSEIELAPNRKPYYDDEELETTKLNRTLASGVIVLGLVAVGLPLYWLAEPGRQEGAREGSLHTFEKRGLEQYEEGSQCANCHGPEGTGGQAPYVLNDANGAFIANLQWRAPALNTVLLRFSRDEVFEIITLGRPGTPMVGWGAAGNGPRTDQEIENLVDYLASVQLSSDEARREVATELAVQQGRLTEEERSDEDKVDAAIQQIDYDSLETGEQLFNLGRESGFASGAYSCGRCHTRGWSMITSGEGAVEPESAVDLLGPYTDYEDGSGGGYAFTLDGVIPRKFASVDALGEFLGTGSEEGIAFGNGGLGTGRMPGFLDNPNTEGDTEDGMYTHEMVCAVAAYASTLQGEDPPLSEPASPAPTVPPTTTTTVAEGEEEPEPPEPAFCSDEALDAAEEEEDS
jgi:cytochrome c553